MADKIAPIFAGHWSTNAGAAMAAEYASKTRTELPSGDLTDFEVAFRTAMIGRHDLDFEASLAVAKDRIRWLSVKLAEAKMDEHPSPAAVAESAMLLEQEIDQAWQDLSDTDDRNSPPEYPDMCLITRKELAEFMGRAKATGGK